jgi:L-threonylcarbamoyladenylate synthase
MVVAAADPHAFARCVDVLLRGGVVIAPGDTMYGMLGIVPLAEQRIRQVKGRGEDKPFLQLIPDPSWTGRFSDMRVPDRLARHWPGPLTIVLPARAGGTVAVRVPDMLFLREVLIAVGEPLYSTSVNRAGVAPLATVAAMRGEFEQDVDLIYDAGDILPGPPSTLVDATTRPARILRRGALQLTPADLG